MSRLWALTYVITLLVAALALRVGPAVANRSAQRAKAPEVRQGADGSVTRPAPHWLSPQTVPSSLRERPLVLAAAGLGIEALLIGTVLYLVLRSAWIGAAFNGVPRRYQLATAALPAMLILGFFGGSVRTFPFMDWHMYAGAPPDEMVGYQFVGRTPDGRPTSLPLNTMIPLLRHHRLYAVLRAQVQQADTLTGGDEAEAAWSRVQNQLRGLLQRYNAAPNGERIVSVDIVKVTLYATAQPARREVLAKVGLERP